MAANFENDFISPGFPLYFRKKSPNFKELAQKFQELWAKTFGGFLKTPWPE